MRHVDVVDYRPENNLDADLANLFRACLSGWPDGRPLTAAAIRGWFRPLSLTATTLASHRDADGGLVAAAALRWPCGPESVGRLLGPFVHPDFRGAGLGRALLEALDGVIAARPGVRVATVGIVESRRAGWSLFERAGWQPAGNASLLVRDLPGGAVDGPSRRAGGEGIAIRIAHPGEYVDPALAELVAGARPQLTYAGARDTYTRWTRDERYSPDGLLLAEVEADSVAAAPAVTQPAACQLIGAALVYPMGRSDTDEPPEATLVDLVVAGGLEPAGAAKVRAALVDAVIAAGIKLGAQVARSFAEEPELVEALLDAGFVRADRIRFYDRDPG